MRPARILSATLLALLLLGGCGREGDGGSNVPDGEAPVAAAQPDAEIFEPPSDWCGTGRMGAPAPAPPAPLETGGMPVRPAPPPQPPIPWEPLDDDVYPPSNWCGTGWLRKPGGLAGSGWQGPDRKGRWWKMRYETRGGLRVRIKTWGEDRDGRFHTWEEERQGLGPAGWRLGGPDGPRVGGTSPK